MLTEYQKTQIRLLSSPHTKIVDIRTKLGISKNQVREFLVKENLPYFGKKPKVRNQVYFSWEDYPFGIY